MSEKVEDLKYPLTHKRLIDNKTFSDLTFVVEGKKAVAAHLAVILARCENLIPAKQKEALRKAGGGKKKSVEITLKEGVQTQSCLLHLLGWAYTDTVDFSSLNIQQVLELNSAAIHFGLNRLQWLCEKHLHSILSMANLFEILKGAHQSQQQAVKGYCLHFAIKNYTEFITNKEGIHALGIDLFQEVVTKYTAGVGQDAEPQQAPPPQLLKQFKQLYETMDLADGVAKVGTEKIRFHRAILAAHSDAFVPLFNTARKDDVDAEFKVSPEAFKSVLKFIYYGDTSVAALPACELIPFTTDFTLNDLKVVCEEKIQNSVAVETVLEILAVTFLPQQASKPEMQELKEKAIVFVLDKLTDIELAALRKMDPRLAIDILFALQAREKGAPVSDRPSVGSMAHYIPPANAASSSSPPASSSATSASEAREEPSGANDDISSPRTEEDKKKKKEKEKEDAKQKKADEKKDKEKKDKEKKDKEKEKEKGHKAKK